MPAPREQALDRTDESSHALQACVAASQDYLGRTNFELDNHAQLLTKKCEKILDFLNGQESSQKNGGVGGRGGIDRRLATRINPLSTQMLGEA
jgi:hypothetical protein